MSHDSARKNRRWLWIVIVAVLVIFAIYLFFRFTRNSPVVYEDIVEHYKYGSLGSEAFSPPFWIWRS